MVHLPPFIENISICQSAGLQRFGTVTETPSRQLSRPHIVEFAPTPNILDRGRVSEPENDPVLEQSAAAEPSK